MNALDRIYESYERAAVVMAYRHKFVSRLRNLVSEYLDNDDYELDRRDRRMLRGLLERRERKELKTALTSTAAPR